MRYFFPGPLETVDPAYDWTAERSNPFRVRHRDDVYAHELLRRPPYHGILLARSAVHPEQGGGRASFGLWRRLLREGARQFLRLPTDGHGLDVMGDCGAYAYASEPVPTVTTQEAIEFYVRCGVDHGLSVDHVVPGYVSQAPRRKWRVAPSEWVERRQLSLELAHEFVRLHASDRLPFHAIGVAQGWDPDSYTDSVRVLQSMGYDYIAVGGLARLPVSYILDCLRSIDGVRDSSTRLHLLGVARPQAIGALGQLGVVSFDSSAPLRRAFLNEDHNYYAPDRTYRAIRIPQSTGNRALRTRVARGELRARDVFRLEREALDGIRAFERGDLLVGDTIARVREYETLCNGKDQSDAYRETLEAAPWRNCQCVVCETLGVDVVLLRGKQRNNRRGFHNLQAFLNQVEQQSTPELDD